MQGVKGSRLHYSQRKQYIDSKGYLAIRVNGNEEKRIHRLIVEEVLGKSLPKGAVVHHIDGNYLNNAKNNLIVLQNSQEHKRLHTLQRLQNLGVEFGRTHYCYKCKEIKSVECFTKGARYHTGLNQICKVCASISKKEGYYRKKAENGLCEPYLLSKLTALGEPAGDEE